MQIQIMPNADFYPIMEYVKDIRVTLILHCGDEKVHHQWRKTRESRQMSGSQRNQSRKSVRWRWIAWAKQQDVGRLMEYWSSANTLVAPATAAAIRCIYAAAGLHSLDTAGVSIPVMINLGNDFWIVYFRATSNSIWERLGMSHGSGVVARINVLGNARQRGAGGWRLQARLVSWRWDIRKRSPLLLCSTKGRADIKLLIIFGI